MRTEPLEKDIQKSIVHLLNLRRIPHAITNAERVWNPKGFVRKSKVSPDHPDISATLPVLINGTTIGLSFYIEVKRPSGKVSDGQRAKLRELASAGALCIIARSANDVMRAIDDFRLKELSAETLNHYRHLLEVNLSDRRTKEARAQIEALGF